MLLILLSVVLSLLFALGPFGGALIGFRSFLSRAGLETPAASIALDDDDDDGDDANAAVVVVVGVVVLSIAVPVDVHIEWEGRKEGS